MDNKEGTETEESEDYNETSITRPSMGSIGSDGDYDDDLGIPGSIKLLDMGDGPIAIENSDDDLEDEQENIPYHSVLNYKKFTSFERNVFIPGLDINVAITDYERNLTSHMLNPNLYTILLTHGHFTWFIKKRYKQIQYLHQQLLLFRTSLNIPFPSKTHKKKRQNLKQTNVKTKGKRKAALPRFPKKPEVLVSYDRIGNRMKQIESYLNNLLSIPIYRNHPATIDFLEVSHLSFIEGLGLKGKEGFVKKRTGSAHPGQSGCNFFGLFHFFCCVRFRHICNDLTCTRYVKRWFFIKDTFFGYINPETGIVRAVVLFDQGFEVAASMYAIGLQNGFQIQTLSRQITFKSWTRRKVKEWTEALKEVAATSAREFVQINRFHSFAPIRINITASWFVDGASYMSAVGDAIQNAKEEVFITDWWLSPEIYLKRPAILGDYWQLNKVLERKAASGVKIYILLYKEVEMALGLNSYYSKRILTESSSPNIKVLRHPDHAKAGVFLWAHHEKMVVVDQTYAFVGGIDLCYGRWDDDKHRLTDLGSITPSVDISTIKKKTSSVPGGEAIYPIPVPYYKRTPKEDIQEQEPVESCLHANNVNGLPQLEPGDNLLICKPEKLKMNTPQPDRKHILDSLKDKGKELMNLVYTPHEYDQPEPVSPPDEKDQIDGQTPEQIIDSLDGSAKLWLGKDYVNFIVKDFTNLESPFDDFIERTTTPRMPWHDIGMCVQGDAARDVARHFIHRWNATKLEKVKNNPAYPYIMPKSYGGYKTLPVDFPNKTHKVTCQMLRSVSCWSAGFLQPDTVEQSIHEAYIDTITKSQHYIYIENQFFISLSAQNPHTKNQIGEALFKRIIRAHRAKEIFRVYVVMPLLPGFEGEVGAATGTSLHAITHWNYASISQGKDAILNKLIEAGIECPSEYISFYGLRNHSSLNSEPITELIYVHSKLMIVDDKTVICGSANINDRSLIGKRDSEVAVIIEDETFDDGVMNGKPFPCGKFAGSLRKYLFREHLGLLDVDDVFDIDVSDPISNYFYKDVWYQTARLNTDFYEKVFHCLPTDSVQTFADLRKIHEEKPLWVEDIGIAEKMLESIQGHIVLLPLNFLSKEYLMPAANSVEGMMPTSLWT